MMSNKEIQYETRKPRTCTTVIKPLLVLLLIILNAYCFFVLCIAQHTSFASLSKYGADRQHSAPTVGAIVNWVIYYLITVMALWSLASMSLKSPGYVPNNYRYDLGKMRQHDRLIYETLKQVLHSTYQQIGREEGEQPHGSIPISSEYYKDSNRNSGGIFARIRASFGPGHGKSEMHAQHRNDSDYSSNDRKSSTWIRKKSRDRDGAMTISYRHQLPSQAGTSDCDEDGGEGLVYFIETEPEEIFQIAEHTSQGTVPDRFSFKDNPSPNAAKADHAKVSDSGSINHEAIPSSVENLTRQADKTKSIHSVLTQDGGYDNSSFQKNMSKSFGKLTLSSRSKHSSVSKDDINFHDRAQANSGPTDSNPKPGYETIPETIEEESDNITSKFTSRQNSKDDIVIRMSKSHMEPDREDDVSAKFQSINKSSESDSINNSFLITQPTKTFT